MNWWKTLSEQVPASGDPLEPLTALDPQLEKRFAAALAEAVRPVDKQTLAEICGDILWGFGQEIAFGSAIAEGYLQLVGRVALSRLNRFHELIRGAGPVGPTYGRLLASHLWPFLRYADAGLIDRFTAVVTILKAKGVHLFDYALAPLREMLETNAPDAADSYLDLLADVFVRDLTYSQALHFSRHLPAVVTAFAHSRRVWQTEQFRRVLSVDPFLADAFAEGMTAGLNLLHADALKRFVSMGLSRYAANPKLGRRFFGLASQAGADAYTALQVAVGLSQITDGLERYLRARTGRRIAVRPLSMIVSGCPSYADRDPHSVAACSDAEGIYLPDEIRRFGDRDRNQAMYRCLAKLEAACHEFGSFEFDLERLVAGYASLELNGVGKSVFEAIASGLASGALEDQTAREQASDLEMFWAAFPNPALAEDLYTICEHGRLRSEIVTRYPGVDRLARRMATAESAPPTDGPPVAAVMVRLYQRAALGLKVAVPEAPASAVLDPVEAAYRIIADALTPEAEAETSGWLVCRLYARMAALETESGGAYRRVRFPLGRRLRPDLVHRRLAVHDIRISAIRSRLQERGLTAYRADLRRTLVESNGDIDPFALQKVVRRQRDPGAAEASPGLQAVDLSAELNALFGRSPSTTRIEPDSTTAEGVWYREWDCGIRDYLPDHVRLIEKPAVERDDGFYESVLARRRGLVGKLRYAFELLKPAGLHVLRQWPEGDEFDYRALIDYGIDSKAGRSPDDRLYIKRIKKIRDVAVLLLVDLSRSTAHRVPGTEASVLDIEKEAIVLFCEALETVGDAYSLAGFSGSGRLQVEYFPIKGFGEHLTVSPKRRISAMAPKRSTRMGAAIRHATGRLDAMPNTIRLLILLSDGFPNDVDYKRAYAVTDTRRAISEARSRGIFTHAITVNVSADAALDSLYGNVHHNVIADVRELPDKLVRIYGALTR